MDTDRAWTAERGGKALCSGQSSPRVWRLQTLSKESPPRLGHTAMEVLPLWWFCYFCFALPWGCAKWIWQTGFMCRVFLNLKAYVQGDLWSCTSSSSFLSHWLLEWLSVWDSKQQRRGSEGEIILFRQEGLKQSRLRFRWMSESCIVPPKALLDVRHLALCLGRNLVCGLCRGIFSGATKCCQEEQYERLASGRVVLFTLEGGQ